MPSSADRIHVGKRKSRRSPMHDDPEKKRPRKASAILMDGNNNNEFPSNGARHLDHSLCITEQRSTGMVTPSPAVQAEWLSHMSSDLLWSPHRYHVGIESRQLPCGAPNQNRTHLVAKKKLDKLFTLAQKSAIMPLYSDLLAMPLVGAELHLSQPSSWANLVRDTLQRSHETQSLHLDWTRRVVGGNNLNQIVESTRLLEALGWPRRVNYHGQIGSLLSLLSPPCPWQINGPQTWGAANFLLETRNNNEPKPKRSILVLATPQDQGRLNEQQIFLRHQIEVFRATVDDIMSHTRGRNKPVSMWQVGLRCRHCGHLPVGLRRKGSTYFPSTLRSIYQAAQNLNIEHLQSGVCSEMPHEIQQLFQTYGEKRAVPSAAGKPYWADAGRQLGLVDTEEGIRFSTDLGITCSQYPGFGVVNNR